MRSQGSFISLPEIVNSLLLTITPTHIIDKDAALRVTRMMPVITPATLPQLEKKSPEQQAVDFYTIDMVRKYLDSDTLDFAREQLKEARSHLSGEK